MSDSPVHVHEIFINASAARVWQAIVEGDQTVQYFYGTRVESTWVEGDEIVYFQPDGSRAAEGRILSVSPGEMVEMSFLPLWDPELTAEGGVREIWRLTGSGELSKLAVELYGIAPGGPTHRDFVAGLPYIVSGLKSFVETGHGLNGAGPPG